MTKNAVLSTKNTNQNALNAPLAEGLNPDLLVQLHQYINDNVQQKMKEQEAAIRVKVESTIRTELESELRLQIEQEIKAEYEQRFIKDLDQQIADLKAQFAKRFEKELALGIANGVAEQVREIIEQARLARIRTYGPKNESSAQLSLFNEVELINEENQEDLHKAEVVTKTKTTKQKPRGHRRPLPPELPRVELVVDVKESDRIDANGKPMVRIGEEISEKLDIIPMKIRVIRTIRPKYAPADGNGSPIIAKALPSILPRSNLSASALAMLLTVKYVDGQPLYRFNKVLKRHGIDIPRQTLARNVIEVSKALQPIANLMRDTLLDSNIIHMDETSVQVLKEPGRKPSSTSYMWVQYGGPPDKKVVMFDYRAERNGSVPKELLQGWTGYLMTDGYAGYNEVVGVHNNEVVGEQKITHLACMAHARRRFVDAKKVAVQGKPSNADIAIKMFAKLYHIEKRIKNAPPEFKLKIRQKYSKKVLDRLNTWVVDMLPKVTPTSKLGDALSYTNNMWPKLIRYIENGSLPIDNNVCENAIRPFVIGRKNWLFSSTQAGADASALIYSLVETAKANDKEPYAWLSYILERLPYATNVDEVEKLLPWNTSDEDLAMDIVNREEWG